MDTTICKKPHIIYRTQPIRKGTSTALLMLIEETATDLSTKKSTKMLGYREEKEGLGLGNAKKDVLLQPFRVRRG